MVKFIRYSRVFRFYEALQPFLKYSPSIEEKLPGKKALVIAPHPDDEAIGCGGTVAKHVKSGGCAEVVFCASDGGARDEESARAAEILGIKNARRLGFNIESLKGNKEFGKKLAAVIDETRPDVVFIPFILDNHTDHRAANAALAAGGFKWDGFMVYAYPVWLPLYPNVIVDISAEWPVKEKAINCYKSQLATRDYVKMSRSLGEYWAAVKGRDISVAETFFKATYAEYKALYKKITNE
jgi:LmbE family N-acetylglucosaminyl deacetylase